MGRRAYDGPASQRQCGVSTCFASRAIVVDATHVARGCDPPIHEIAALFFCFVAPQDAKPLFSWIEKSSTMLK
jgi:hypothetical protein